VETAGAVPDTSVLCINAGSSTMKCARFEVGADGEPHETGRVERPAGPAALEEAMAVLAGPDGSSPRLVAHRIVHGGPRLLEHCVVDEDVLDQLRAATEFAPLHLPSEVAGIDAVAARIPGTVQVACFDTAFHRTLPPVARRLPIPEDLHDAGVHRYGFHGLSCEHVVEVIGAATLGRAVIAHLGSGASLTAVRDGRSADTTMGLTPAGGVVMATRTGDLDPGVVFHLLRGERGGPEAIEALLTRQGGLLALSGRTGDMRTLLDARSRGDERAALAVDAFCTGVAKHIGALVTVLGGLDTIVFTGGIGEHAPTVRWFSCARLAHLGVRLDDDANDAGAPVVSGDGAVVVRVVPTDENLVMARHATRLCPPDRDLRPF